MKWIKLMTDLYDNKKIKYLRSLPEGNNIALIWTMLLTAAGKCNADGVIYLTESIPYTPAMLAAELDFPENTIKIALESFIRLDMIVMDGDYIAISSWNEHQSSYVSSGDEIYKNESPEERKKRKSRERQQRYRQRQAALNPPEELRESNADVTQKVTLCNADVTQCNASVTESHFRNADVTQKVTPLYIDTDKELEVDNNSLCPADAERGAVEKIVSYLNEKTGSQYKPNTKKTVRLIQSRLSEGFTVDDFYSVIDKRCKAWLNTSYQRFLIPSTLFGENFEGYLNCPDIVECNEVMPRPRNAFHNFEQRNYNYSALENILFNQVAAQG